jgi:hypothetical protein
MGLAITGVFYYHEVQIHYDQFHFHIYFVGLCLNFPGCRNLFRRQNEIP